MSFATLLSPIHIGSMELRNRLVMSPMETLYSTRDGQPSDRAIAYYEARAEGGVGLITLGACTIDAEHREVPNSIDFGRDEVIDAHRELTERIHRHGAKIQPQIVHPGPDGLAPYMSGQPNIGPSVIPSYLTGLPSRELGAEELPAIADRYAAAVARVKACGYDGIELHAAHGYMLLGSFLTPARNRRTDAYAGNTVEGRTRLIVEVLQAIRREVGGDFPVTLRISGYERVPGGRDIQDTQRIAPLLVEAGVDAFHVSGGVIDRLTSQMVTGSHYGPAHNVGAAAAVKQVVDVPVIAVGRIHDPVLAERILREGRADLVAMARPLLADPDLIEKTQTGRAHEIRRCISCQNCIDEMESGRMHCAVNARSGREEEIAAGPTSNRRSVLVVGGGPGGLEAARVAARRGHRVALHERESRLGGALVMASTVHADNEPLLEFLLADVQRARVDVHLNSALDASKIAALSPDVVVVATGGRVVAPELPGSDAPHVLDGPLLRELLSGRLSARAEAKLPSWQRWAIRFGGVVLRRGLTPERLRRFTRAWMPVGPRVAIVGGDLAAIELAEFLAERGRRVSVLERGTGIAPEVGLKRRTEHMDRLDRLAVAVHTEVAVDRIELDAVVLDGGQRIAADSVILAGELEPATELADALEAQGTEVVAVGDCTGLGLIRKAIEEGARAGASI